MATKASADPKQLKNSKQQTLPCLQCFDYHDLSPTSHVYIKWHFYTPVRTTPLPIKVITPNRRHQPSPAPCLYCFDKHDVSPTYNVYSNSHFYPFNCTRIPFHRHLTMRRSYWLGNLRKQIHLSSRCPASLSFLVFITRDANFHHHSPLRVLPHFIALLMRAKYVIMTVSSRMAKPTDQAAWCSHTQFAIVSGIMRKTPHPCYLITTLIGGTIMPLK